MKAKRCEIVSNLEYLTLEKIQEVLGKCNYIKEYAYILHDKDINEDGSAKSPHWHIFLRFKDATEFKYIANYFGLAENFIGKILGKWEDALMYATHKNAPEKYQYPDTAVTSNFSYTNVIEEYMEKSANRYTLDSIIEMIDREDITQYNYIDKIPFNVRVKFQRSIDKAFQEKTKEKSKNYKRNISVVYMSGPSGIGKTSYAQYFAEEQGYSYCVSGSSNDPLESYNGEKCLILDELRPDDWSFSDLLKLLDNNTGSMIKSRFHNKFFVGDLIIITSHYDIYKFAEMLKNSKGEDLKQFFRRCDTWLKFDKEFIYFRGFNNETGDYAINITAIRNPIENLYKKQKSSYIEKWKKIGLLKEECEVETLCGEQWLYHKPAEDIEGVDEVLAYMEQSPKYIRLNNPEEEETENDIEE